MTNARTVSYKHSFHTRLKVVEHKKEAHGFECDKCKKPFEEDSQLAEHIEVNLELKYKSCTEIFDFSNKLEEHTKKEHYFICKECDDALATTEA